MLNLLLETAPAGAGISQYLMLGVLVLFFVGMMVFSSRSQKKRQQKVKDMIESLKVGDKVKTIGGIIGKIVEICPDNAFVIETGSNTMKSYMKFDKSAIYASGEGQSEKPVDKADEKEYDAVVEEEETK